MKKFMGSLRQPSRRSSQTPVAAGSPEEGIKRDIQTFIDSNSNSSSGPGDEAIHLPQIVEAAEASPDAAAVATKTIRKALANDQWNKAYKQYHAVMLFRILIDNPGSCKHVAKKVDDKLRMAFKLLLRTHRDPSVQQITRETLDHFAQEKSDVHELKPLHDMWLKEKGNTGALRQLGPLGRPGNDTWRHDAPYPTNAQASHTNGRQRHALPNQAELAGRIEEAKTSAKLLIQLTQSTPPAEFNSNELIKEFADRCQSAQRSLHGYMNADPPPDEETCQTLIETCEQLSLASSKHQRAALAARKQTKEPLTRAEELYTSRDVSPNPAGAPAQQQRAAPAPPGQLNTLAPLSRHASPREQVQEKESEPFNPFGDENASNYPPMSSRQYHTSRASPPAVNAPFAELPTTSTPPPGQSAFNPPVMNGERVAPPPGPPPGHPAGRKPVPPADPHGHPNGVSELDYQTSRRPLTADSDDLYGADEPVVHGARHSDGMNGEYEAMPSRHGKGRVKDDEPFSPVGGVSGSGWNY